MPLVRRLVKGVAAGIGASREAYESHKRSKEQQQRETEAGPSTSAPPPDYEEVSEEKARELIARGEAIPADTDSKHLSSKALAQADVSEGEESEEDDDEIAWELDEAQEAADPPSYEATIEGRAGSSEEVDVPELVREVLHKVGPYPAAVKRMPYPIVIPQRRPRSKNRGFVRAYPPILDNYGISQDAFLTLLKAFHQASKPSKYIAAVFVAAGIVGMVPSVYAMAVSTAVQFAAGTAAELQRRYRANTFLDQLNEHLFKPRGLFAMVMCFKPNATRPMEVAEIDADALVAQRETAPTNTLAATGRKLKVAQGSTYGEVELGEVAPLIYPSLDAAAADPNSCAFKRASKFLQEYGDRRAQAVYNAQHPGSTLGNPQETKFVSRYSDPNHPASSGSLISLLTGGHVNPTTRKQQRRQWRNDRRIARGRTPRSSRDPDEPKGIIRRMLREVS